MSQPRTVEETLGRDICPKGGCTIRYSAADSVVRCSVPGCGMEFNVTPEEAPEEPQDGPREPQEPADGPPEPEEPQEPPTVEEEQEAIHADTAPSKGGVEPPESEEPQEPPADQGEPEDAVPVAADSAASPSEVRAARARGASRKNLPPIERPDGITEFIFQGREFQWVARGGLGNPYHPGSVGHEVFDIVAQAGEEGIDPIEVCIELRRRLAGRDDCTSILQRVSAVIERTCLNPYVGLMQRVNSNSDLVRVPEKHRGDIHAPQGMVGARRRFELEQKQGHS